MPVFRAFLTNNIAKKIKCGNTTLLVTDVIHLTTEPNLVTLIVRLIREC